MVNSDNKTHILDGLDTDASYSSACALVLVFLLLWTASFAYLEPVYSRKLAFKCSRYAQVQTCFGGSVCAELARGGLVFLQHMFSLAFVIVGYEHKSSVFFLVGVSSEIAFRIHDVGSCISGSGMHENDDFLVRVCFGLYSALFIVNGLPVAFHPLLLEFRDVHIIFVGLLASNTVFALLVLVQYTLPLMTPQGCQMLLLAQVSTVFLMGYFRFIFGVFDGNPAYLSLYLELDHSHPVIGKLFAASAYLFNFVYGSLVCWLIGERFVRTLRTWKRMAEVRRKLELERADPSEMELQVYTWSNTDVRECVLMAPHTMLTHYVRKHGWLGKRKKKAASKKKAQ